MSRNPHSSLMLEGMNMMIVFIDYVKRLWGQYRAVSVVQHGLEQLN